MKYLSDKKIGLVGIFAVITCLVLFSTFAIAADKGLKKGHANKNDTALTPSSSEEPTPLPYIIEFSPRAPYVVEAGRTLLIDVTALTQDGTLNIYMDYNGAPEGAGLSILKIYPQNHGTFMWTPSIEQVRTEPYTIRFYAEGEKGQVNAEISITVLPDTTPPLADFTASPTAGEAPLTVNFADASQGNITSWSWDFGDGYTSVEQNPWHEYLTPGSYTVSLTVTNSVGSDKAVKDGYIKVDATGAIEGYVYYEMGDKEVRLPDMEVQLWVKDPEAPDYVYSASDVTDANGNYGFQGLKPEFLSGSLSSTVYKIKVPAQGIYPVYESEPLQFYNYYWPEPWPGHDLYHRVRINYVWWGPGIINGNVTYSSDGRPAAGVTVILKPHAYGYGTHDYTSTTDEKGNYEVTDVIRYVQSSGGTVTWIRYTVVVSKEGGEDYVSEELPFSETVFHITHNVQLPFHEYWRYGTISGWVYDGAATKSLAGVTVALEENNFYEGWLVKGTVTTGENGNYEFTNVSRWYNVSSGGTRYYPPYRIRVATEDYKEYLSEEFQYVDPVIHIKHDVVLIPLPPVADFIASPTAGQAPLTVNFEDASQGIITSWSWDFGDGYTGVEQNPWHEYLTPGSYTVSLAVTGPGGGSTAVKDGYINVEVPTAIRLDTDPPWSAASVEPQVASDDSGHVYAVWLDMRDENWSWKGGIRFNYSHDYGMSWQTGYGRSDMRLDVIDGMAAMGGSTEAPKIACDNEGNVYVVWSKTMESPDGGAASVYFQHSSDYGVTWLSEEMTIGPASYFGYYNEKPQVCVDNRGYVYVVWQMGYDILFRASSDHGLPQTWGPIKYLSPQDTIFANPNTHERPQISCYDSGHVYVAFVNDGGLSLSIVASADCGGTWGYKKVLGVGYPVQEIKLACDDKGHVYAAWVDWRSGNDDVYFNYSADYGKTWQQEDMNIDIDPVIIVDPPYSANSGDTNLGYDNNGNVYIAWRRKDSINGAVVRFRRSYTYGERWEDIKRIDTEYVGIPDAERPRMDSDDNGNIYVIYSAFDDETGIRRVHLVYSTTYSEQWLGKAMPISSLKTKVGNSQISSDKRGHVYIVREEITQTYLLDIYPPPYDIFFTPVTIEVRPNLSYIEDQFVTEGDVLSFKIYAINTRGTPLDLDWSANEIPDDNLRIIIETEAFLKMPLYYNSYTGESEALFRWCPSYDAAGEYRPVVFFATDPETKKRDYQDITITVKDKQTGYGF